MGRSALRDIVLVIEDEPVLRMAAVDMLQDAGFDTVEAGSTAEGVTILESRTDIRLVFTDIDMPYGMDGMELAAVIRNRWPPIEIVLTSSQEAPATETLPARCVFYPKPYRPQQVIDTLRSFARSLP